MRMLGDSLMRMFVILLCIFVILLCILIIGCEKVPQTGRLLCGNCRRVIYEGKFEGDPNGFRWPVGHINHCKPWDINCVSEFLPERDKEHKVYWGYEQGRKDALEFRYEKEMDPKVYHHHYIEGYKKGYKEVIDVKRLGNKDDEHD